MKVILREDVTGYGGWLNPGQVYTVLSVERSGAHAHLRLWADRQETCALFPAMDFRVVDAHLSRLWLVDADYLHEYGGVNLLPIEWQSRGFLERYYDGDPGAVEIFERCMREILAE
jgi:hypothetical protein